MDFITWAIVLTISNSLVFIAWLVMHVQEELTRREIELDKAKDITPQWPSVWPDVPGDKIGGGESGKS